MQDKLKTTHYKCPKCGTWKNIESLGVVVTGPTCNQCKKPMIKVQAAQAELSLFHKAEK